VACSAGDAGASSSRGALRASAADAASVAPAAAVAAPLFAPDAPAVLFFVSRDSGPQSGGALAARLRAAVGAAQARRVRLA
jgi:hypothetical protein